MREASELVATRRTSSSVGPLATKSAMMRSSRCATRSASTPGLTSTCTSKMPTR
jgi:hypothetical protein